MEKEFITLLNQYPGILYKICKVYGNKEEDRKDLFQEIVLQLWKAYPLFRSEANPGTWMYRVAMNTAISIFRKEQRRKQPTPFSYLPFPLPDPPDDTSPNSALPALYKAIDQLSAIEKGVVVLYLDDKSYQEMALILGISKSNVGVKLSRIKSKLEKLIKSFSH